MVQNLVNVVKMKTILEGVELKKNLVCVGSRKQIKTLSYTGFYAAMFRFCEKRNKQVETRNVRSRMTGIESRLHTESGIINDCHERVHERVRPHPQSSIK